MAAFHTAAALLLVVVNLTPAALAADTAHLNMFMHNILAGSKPTAVRVVDGPGSSTSTDSPLGMSFGDTSVIDDPLTETASSTSATVGRVQGLYMVSSQSDPILTICANIVLTSGSYNGSTIAVLGRLDDTLAALTDASVRELAVVGGTGKFRMATGYVLWKITKMDGPDATIELDVYVSTANRAIMDAAFSFSE